MIYEFLKIWFEFWSSDPIGSLVISFTCQWSVSPSVGLSLNILEAAQKFLLKLCIKFGESLH